MSAGHLHVHRRRKDLASNKHPNFVNGASEESREQQYTALRELAREHVGGMDWSMNEGLQLALPSLQLDVQLPSRDDGASARFRSLRPRTRARGAPALLARARAGVRSH